MATYQAIVNEIRQASMACLENNGRFIHGRIVDASRVYEGKYPLIVLYPFIIRKGESEDNEIFDSTQLFMGFWMQDAPDTTEEQREAIIAEMDILSEVFLDSLRDSSTVRLSAVDKEPQYQFYQATLSGFALRFNITTLTPC
jgi:hypothetical protein